MTQSSPLLKLLSIFIALYLSLPEAYATDASTSNVSFETSCTNNYINMLHTEQDDVIKYTLTEEDYTLVGNGGFSNFDIREGYDEETVTVRLAKINKILLANFPNYKKGQKVEVSYNVWKPGDDVFVMKVIHNGEKYILQRE